ncbi:hypothetical protein SAMN04487950_0593 [Halogranum rubrum]|uniref:Uncharacterized protein n=1 Tax=Halogranum rubrum TaxID=553466 RepID=A0A1I4BJ60_9EURY|nr:hypothetical protein SAMN04487950_0593 [Halogranum rubrum]
MPKIGTSHNLSHILSLSLPFPNLRWIREHRKLSDARDGFSDNA